jgi:hypothetical protein
MVKIYVEFSGYVTMLHQNYPIIERLEGSAQLEAQGAISPKD